MPQTNEPPPTDGPAQPEKPASGLLGRYVVRIGLGAVLLGVVVYQLQSQWHELSQTHVGIAWRWLGLAAAIYACCLGVAAELWRRLMQAAGAEVSFATSFRIYYLSNLAKYLPGGVWNLIGRVALSKSHGIDGAKCATALAMEMLLQVLAMAIAGPLALAPVLPGSWLAHPAIPAGATIATLVAMHPSVLNRLLGYAERVVRRSLPRVELSYGLMLQMLGMALVLWVMLGTSMACIGRALLPELSPSGFLLLAGATIVAWLMGLAAFFLPGGLGARELGITAVLSASHPAGWPALFALVSRVCITTFELAAFILASRLGRRAPQVP